jgi:hypothetical protein
MPRRGSGPIRRSAIRIVDQVEPRDDPIGGQIKTVTAPHEIDAESEAELHDVALRRGDLAPVHGRHRMNLGSSHTGFQPTLLRLLIWTIAPALLADGHVSTTTLNVGRGRLLGARHQVPNSVSRWIVHGGPGSPLAFSPWLPSAHGSSWSRSSSSAGVCGNTARPNRRAIPVSRLKLPLRCTRGVAALREGHGRVVGGVAVGGVCCTNG